jgi:hypothetical protein
LVHFSVMDSKPSTVKTILACFDFDHVSQMDDGHPECQICVPKDEKVRECIIKLEEKADELVHLLRDVPKSERQDFDVVIPGIERTMLKLRDQAYNIRSNSIHQVLYNYLGWELEYDPQPP